ncbi:DUF4190 domain-containing protein [Leucobacter sp. USCH14]|uniref:DUF4190 domain-containing protein n=1 Tax=Leucobacter sp. USCH14 TaxID=3024838 RepID=UPI0030A73868
MTHPVSPPSTNAYEHELRYAPPPVHAYPPPRTNTLSIIAFIGSFLLSFTGIILGAISLSQIKRTRESGRGLAIAAIIIGSVGTAIALLWGAFIVFAMYFASLYPTGYATPYDPEPRSSSHAHTYGDDAHLDRLWDACDAGDDDACSDLYWESPLGSEYEEFGQNDGRLDSGLTS